MRMLPRPRLFRPRPWDRAVAGAAARSTEDRTAARRDGDRVVGLGVAIGLVLLGNCYAVTSRSAPTALASSAEATVVNTAPIPAGPAAPVVPGKKRPRLLPVQVAAPRVGIRAGVTRLAKAKDNTLEVPADFDLTGWYAAGPAPGEPGAAVVVGHVDSFTGPAVFFRLGRLKAGDRIDVRRTDRSVVQFTVQFVATYAKDSFPTGLVYQRTDGPTLRLVTCGGRFDRRSKSYESNVVVFASASRVVPPPKGPAAPPK